MLHRQTIVTRKDPATHSLDTQLGIEHYLRQHGIAHTHRQRFGRMVAKLKRRELEQQGLPPVIPQRQELVGGFPALVNLYYEDDRPLFDEALVNLKESIAQEDIQRGL